MGICRDIVAMESKEYIVYQYNLSKRLTSHPNPADVVHD